MKHTPNVFGGEVWRRGARLGLRWTAVFFGVTGITYFLLGIVGWSGTVRALCAMGVGPIIGTAIIVGWWVIRRPAWAAPGDEPAEREGGKD